MSLIDRFNEVAGTVDKLVAEHERKKGQLIEVEKELKRLGISDPDNADSEIEKMRKKVAANRKRIEEELTRLEEKMNEFLVKKDAKAS